MTQQAITARSIRLIGCPMDLGAGRRGVDMGPSALRIAGIGSRLEALGHRVSDFGDIVVRTPESQTAQDASLRFLPEIASACTNLADAVAVALQQGELPLVLGGDHSMSIGTLAGLSMALGDKRGQLGVLWVDAHADINTPATSPSGNIHGMPLAVALGHGHGLLTSIGGPHVKLDPSCLVYLGLRSVDQGEREMIHELGIRAYTMTDIDRRGIAELAGEALTYLLERCAHLHVSFDLDVLDPAIAPGVGTPVPGGITYREAHFLMETIADSGRLGSLEIAEVNPILDIRNQSSELGAGLAASCLGQRVL